jgi:hypothetical protein
VGFASQPEKVDAQRQEGAQRFRVNPRYRYHKCRCTRWTSTGRSKLMSRDDGGGLLLWGGAMVCECGGGWMMEERIEGEMIASHGFCNHQPAYSIFCGRSRS